MVALLTALSQVHPSFLTSKDPSELPASPGLSQVLTDKCDSGCQGATISGVRVFPAGTAASAPA